MTDLNKIYKSVLDADRAPVVICDLEHVIIYMNPSAVEHYGRFGGKALLGKNLLDCHGERSRELIRRVVDRFKTSDGDDMVFTFHNDKENKDVYMVALRDEDKKLIGYYEKHEYRERETMEMYAGLD